MSKYILNTGLTLSELSRKSGVPYSTVQEYLSAKKDLGKCSVGTLHSMASALGVTMDYLYTALTKEKSTAKEKKYAGIRLPSEFKGAFWDRDFENLDLDEEKDFIIIRLFMHEGFRGMKYAEDTFSREEILHAIKTRRDLNPVVANFLQKRYNLKRCDMNYYTAVQDAGQDWRPKNALGNIR